MWYWPFTVEQQRAGKNEFFHFFHFLISNTSPFISAVSATMATLNGRALLEAVILGFDFRK